MKSFYNNKNVNEEEITALNFYVSNNRASKNIEQKLTEQQGKIDKNYNCSKRFQNPFFNNLQNK